jgi:DNA methylase
MLGFPFVGVDVRADQVEANRETVKGRDVSAQWVEGDSATIDTSFPGGVFDLVFTDPPYFNLEKYSGDERDGSTHRTYRAFLAWYTGILIRAAAVLRDNRFMVIKIGEARDRRGAYTGIVGDTVRVLTDAGLLFYNDAILVTAVGSLPVRAGRVMSLSRKLGRTHQNVIVMYKGDPSAIGTNFPALAEAADLEPDAAPANDGDPPLLAE